MRRPMICNLFLLTFLLVTTVAAALDAPGLIAAAPPVDAFSDEDIVIIYRAETVDVDEDGRLVRRVHALRRLQTQWAVRSRSDVRVAWDADRQDLEVVTARTFMRDGTVVPTPDNGFNEVTPGAVSRAAVFLNWREMVISHVGTEPGCVLELEYVLRDREPGPLPPSGVTWFGAEYPVLESRFIARGVEGIPINADPELFDDMETTWVMRDLPAYPTEGPTAQRHHYVPHLVWSDIAGHEAMAAALRAHNEAAAGTAPSLANWLAEARQDPALLTDGDLVQRIADLVHDGTAGVHLPGGPWAAVPRPAADVFATAIGTDWERTLLAMALLREAGWQPEIGIFGQAPLAEHQSVVAHRFPRLRVVVRVGDENWWIAPERAEAWTGNADLADWTGLFLAADGGHRVYTTPLRSGTCRWSAHLSPGPDGGWTATGDLVLQGPYRPRGQDARDLADRLGATLLPDGKVTDVTIREDSPQTLSLRVTTTADALGEADADLLIRDLPWPDHGVLAHLPADLHPERPTRDSSLWINTPGLEEVTLRLDLPAAWHLDTPLVGERSKTTPACTFTQSVLQDAQTITLTRSLTINQAEVTPTDYPAFRTVITTAQEATTTPLVILTD